MRGAAALSWSTRSGRPALPAVVAREPPQGSPRQSADPTRTPGVALFALLGMVGSGASGQCGPVAAEGEHRQGDERFGGVEAERDAGQHPDLGVGGFDQPLGQAVVEGGVDRVAVFDDAVGEFDEDRDAAAPSPRDPFVERRLAGLPLTENTCRRPSLSK